MFWMILAVGFSVQGNSNGSVYYTATPTIYVLSTVQLKYYTLILELPSSWVF